MPAAGFDVVAVKGLQAVPSLPVGDGRALAQERLALLVHLEEEEAGDLFAIFAERNALAAQDASLVPDAVDQGGVVHGFPSISASIASTAALSGTISTVAACQTMPASTSS